MSDEIPREHEETEAERNTGSLAELLNARGISLSIQQVEQLDRYRAMLWSWNEKLNLTRHTTIAKFVDRDVWDSLQLIEHLEQGQRVVDVGSGGGVPGVIIAICRPDLRVTLCESTQKKARVLQSIVTDLGLPTEVFGCRIEELLTLRNFDTLVARAVAPMSKILYWLQPHWGAFDQLLLIKGRSWVEERGEARHRGLMKQLQLRRVAEYSTPQSQSESVILQLRHSGAG